MTKRLSEIGTTEREVVLVDANTASTRTKYSYTAEERREFAEAVWEAAIATVQFKDRVLWAGDVKKFCEEQGL